MPQLRRVACLVALCTSIPAAVRAQAFIEVSSPNFTVVSDAGDKRARDVAWQFEQIRGAILAGWPWARARLDRPVTVVAARNEATMKTLLPRLFASGGNGANTSSLLTEAPDRYTIILRSDLKSDDTDAINPYSAAYWSYSVLTLDAAFESRLPLWFRNGLAEMLSNSIVRDTHIDFGRATPWNIDMLRNEGRLRLEELIEINAESRYYDDPVTRSRFDAQAFAVMHYMLFGRPNDKTDYVNQIATRLLAGKRSADAITEVYGSVQALDQAAVQYHRRPITQYVRLQVATGIPRERFPVRTLTTTETLLLQARVHTVSGNLPEGQRVLAALQKGDANNPEVVALGALQSDYDRRPEQARDGYLRAAELGTQNFYAHYRAAVASWPRNADPSALAVVAKHARRSIELNGAFARAYAILGEALSMGPSAEDGLQPAQTALKLEPASASHRLSLARVLAQMERRDQALGLALAARALARDPDDRVQAQQLIDQLQPK
jgi:hypothetical protein